MLDLLESLGRDPRTVAVERNGTIVRRKDLGSCRLEDGDRVEIVHFVQGGSPQGGGDRGNHVQVG